MNAFVGIATVLTVLALGIRLVGRQHRLLHLLQLEHYESPGMMSSLRRRHELFALSELVSIAVLYVAAIALAALGGSGSSWISGGLLLLTTPIAALGIRDWRRPAVEPLVFTARVQRLLVAVLLPQLLLVLVAISLGGAGLTLAGLIVLLAAAFALLVLAPWTMLATNFALRPVQNAINRHQQRHARHLLGDWAPLTICITGAHGETTKLRIGRVLSTDRPTLVSGEGYDGLLDVVRTINEQLEWRHRTFVVGTSTFSRGDRNELCELVRPKIGVITEIGSTQPEQPGSIEQMAAAGVELLDALPDDGHFVTNADDPHCLQLAASATVPVTLFGIQDLRPADVRHRVLTPQGTPDGSPEALDAAASTAPRTPRSTPDPSKNTNVQVIARDIRPAEDRTEFNLQLDGPDSPLISMSAGLLEPHDLSSLLAAAAVGRVLGIEPARIVEGLGQAHRSPHPEQPIHSC
jgi:UDP-N-acetylmuramoylalanine-D-glutamate ligase